MRHDPDNDLWPLCADCGKKAPTLYPGDLRKQGWIKGQMGGNWFCKECMERILPTVLRGSKEPSQHG